MTAKLDETVERMESRNSIVHRVTGAQARARSHRRGPPRSPQRRFPYSREPPPQRVEQRMGRERSRNVHRVSLRRAAATGATAGMERYVKPQPPAPAQSSQPSARSDSQHFLLNDQEDRIAFWEATQMEAKDKPGGAAAGIGRLPTTTSTSLDGRYQHGDVRPGSGALSAQPTHAFQGEHRGQG